MKIFVTFDPMDPLLGSSSKEIVKNMDKVLHKDLQLTSFYSYRRHWR